MTLDQFQKISDLVDQGMSWEDAVRQLYLIRGERVFVPEFEILECPVFRFRDLRQRSFDVIKRHTK